MENKIEVEGGDPCSENETQTDLKLKGKEEEESSFSEKESFSAEELNESLVKTKKELIRLFSENNAEGINFQRVKDFLGQKGLPFRESIIFTADDLPKIKSLIHDNGLDFMIEIDEKSLGFWSPELGLVFSKRDDAEEQRNGIIVTEGKIVHEQAHGSSGYAPSFWQNQNGKYIMVKRDGLAVHSSNKSSGDILEEGFAEMLRAQYVENNANPEDIKKITDAAGYGNIGLNDTLPIYSGENSYLPLPLKYYHVGSDGDVQAVLSSAAGYAVELLCEAIPDFESHLIEARTSPEGIRKVHKDLISIEGDYYYRLQKRKYNVDDILDGLAEVITKVRGSVTNAVKASGDLEKDWEMKFKKTQQIDDKIQ